MIYISRIHTPKSSNCLGIRIRLRANNEEEAKQRIGEILNIYDKHNADDYLIVSLRKQNKEDKKEWDK